MSLPATSVLTRKPQNLVITTNPAHELNVTDACVPKPGPDDCLIHIRATGICGSDVHFWKDGRIGDSIITGPCGLGHESAGVVIQTGDNVQSFKVGDRVALECGIPCSKPDCRPCRTGQYHACPDLIFFSSPPVDGTLRRYHAHPSAWLHRLPDDMTFETGALLEPLSVALAAVSRSGLRLGDPLVICGAGPIGMVSLLAAHAAGAAPIVITDIDDSRLARARELVSRVRTVLVSSDEDAKTTGTRIKTALGGEAKLVIECTGIERSVHSGIFATQFGGSVYVLGVGKSHQQIPFMHASVREIDIRFGFRYHETYPTAIKLVAEGLIDLIPLVTHRFELEQGREAFHAASNPKAKALKVQVVDDGAYNLMLQQVLPAIDSPASDQQIYKHIATLYMPQTYLDGMFPALAVPDAISDK